MLRINLLPAYINEKRNITTAIVVSSIIWAIILGAGLFYNFGVVQPEVARVKAEAEEQRALATEEAAYEAETTRLLGEIQPLQEKVDFVKLVQYHNTIRQKIFRQAAAYTYREIELNQMAVQGNTLTLGAFAKSVGDIGRFYIYMFGNPDVTAVSLTQGSIPSTNQVRQQTPIRFPGGPPPLPPSYKVGLTATLVQAVAPPQLPASLNSGAPGAPSGAPPGMIDGGAPIDGPAPADAASAP